MPKWILQVRKRLKGAERIALIGVGSELRGDDAAGMLVAKALSKLKTAKPKKFRVFFGSNAPENITGQIKKFNPTHVVIIDAVQMDKSSGSISIFCTEDGSCASGFSTHKMPIRLMLEYLRASLGCQAFIIGIQPQMTEFCAIPSRSILMAVDEVSRGLEELVRC